MTRFHLTFDKTKKTKNLKKKLLIKYKNYFSNFSGFVIVGNANTN